MSIEAMKQALDALALFASDESDEGQIAIAAHEALRQAIKQADQREWVGLTDEEILQPLNIKTGDEYFFKFARAIEAKLKEKNS